MHFTKGKSRYIAYFVFAALMTGLCSGVLPGKYLEKRVQAAEAAVDLEPSVQSAGEVNSDPEASIQPTKEPESSPEASLTPTVEPENILEVKELQMVDNSVDSITIAWIGSVSEAVCYYVYLYNEEEGKYSFIGDTRENYFTCEGLETARKYNFAVRVLDEQNGVQGELSEGIETWTTPEQVTGLSVVHNKVKNIKISWTPVMGADGYAIYRALPGEVFVLAGTSLEPVYKDTGLSSGTTYRYQVCAYSFVPENEGDFSEVIKMTTLPAKPVIQVKGGEKKARITWSAVNGANGYYLYWYNGTEYQFVVALAGKSNTSFVHMNLENDAYTKYKVEAFRVFQGVEYKSTISDAKKALVEKQKATVSTAKLFKTKAGFKNSAAYKNCKALRKHGNYNKSYIIPGLAGTNTDGFYSTSMCPQGITFAGSYFLLSAYDREYEENSVIYVMHKAKKKLLLTVVLPNQTHAGGITYDGYNVWITQAKKMHAIPLAEFENAIAEGKKTYLAAYKVTCALPQPASALTYYKGMIWGASYDELEPGYLAAYKIDDKEGIPVLTNQLLVQASTKIQGLVFTSGGKLILSRSCQTNPQKRGFLHVLDVYKPNLSKLEEGVITLGKIKKSITMPTMNEELAISGKYLYVNFESAAFSTAIQRMDRVCAFKLEDMID